MAKEKKTTQALLRVAKEEKIDIKTLLARVANGTVVIPQNNIKRKLRNPKGIGLGLKIKVNANIGTSTRFASISAEKKKLEAAVKAGADAVMDLSTGGNLGAVRAMVIENSPIPVGSVPIYEAACVAARRYGSAVNIDTELIFDSIERHAQDGIDFITVHCGVTRRIVEALEKKKRVAGIVSRGGAMLARWILKNKKENPLYENFDRLIEIAKKYDLTLSLGDGMRPGATADANDISQTSELKILGELVLRARKAGVQTMVEGPGHMAMHLIAKHVRSAKKIIYGAPYYLLGPLVTDIGAGYDHITGAIGGAIAAQNGADFLCYVTPAEHLCLPNVKDVWDGVMASRIAGHAADIARGLVGAKEVDLELSKRRKALDWAGQKKFALDPGKFDKELQKVPQGKKSTCTMCGEFCSMK